MPLIIPVRRPGQIAILPAQPGAGFPPPGRILPGAPPFFVTNQASFNLNNPTDPPAGTFIVGQGFTVAPGAPIDFYVYAQGVFQALTADSPDVQMHFTLGSDSSPIAGGRLVAGVDAQLTIPAAKLFIGLEPGLYQLNLWATTAAPATVFVPPHMSLLAGLPIG